MSTDTTDTERRELLTFLQGKTIAGLRFDALPGGAFDIIFTDHSELELYNIAGRFTWATMTAEEVAEQEARDLAELDAQTARIAAGEERLYGHSEVWAEIEPRRRGLLRKPRAEGAHQSVTAAYQTSTE